MFFVEVKVKVASGRKKGGLYTQNKTHSSYALEMLDFVKFIAYLPRVQYRRQ